MISDMTWSGAVHMQPGILMFTGAVGSAHMHSHAAVQIMIIDDGDVTVTDGDGHSAVVRSVVIPSGAVHALSASEGARGRAIYIDSTTGMGLRIRPPEPGRGGVTDWSDRGQTAVAMTDRGADSDLEYAARLIDSLSEHEKASSLARSSPGPRACPDATSRENLGAGHTDGHRRPGLHLARTAGKNLQRSTADELFDLHPLVTVTTCHGSDEQWRNPDNQCTRGRFHRQRPSQPYLPQHVRAHAQRRDRRPHLELTLLLN